LLMGDGDFLKFEELLKISTIFLVNDIFFNCSSEKEGFNTSSNSSLIKFSWFFERLNSIVSRWYNFVILNWFFVSGFYESILVALLIFWFKLSEIMLCEPIYISSLTIFFIYFDFSTSLDFSSV